MYATAKAVFIYLFSSLIRLMYVNKFEEGKTLCGSELLTREYRVLVMCNLNLHRMGKFIPILGILEKK